jgi:hypothetical protein
MLKAALFLEALGLRRIARDPALPLSHRNAKARLQPLDRSAQSRPGIQQVGIPSLPLITGGAGDRPCPPRRRRCGQSTLASRPPVILLVQESAETTAGGKIAAGQPPKMLTDPNQHLLIGSIHPQPSANSGTCGTRVPQLMGM